MRDYFGVLISVILGLALTHVLRGLGRIIQMRHEVRSYWVHIVWAINVVIYVLAIWWSMYYWKGLEDWNFEWFFFIAGYAIAVFMWAYMLFPAEFPAGVDFNAFFLPTAAGSSLSRWLCFLRISRKRYRRVPCTCGRCTRMISRNASTMHRGLLICPSLRWHGSARILRDTSAKQAPGTS